jgi:hypothetical protein
VAIWVTATCLVYEYDDDPAQLNVGLVDGVSVSDQTGSATALIADVFAAPASAAGLPERPGCAAPDGLREVQLWAGW